MRTYYEILNVPPDAETAVIRAAFRTLIGKYHPDKFRGDPAEADRIAKLINEAYAVLSHASSRVAYDTDLRARAARRQERKQVAPKRMPAARCRPTTPPRVRPRRDRSARIWLPVAGLLVLALALLLFVQRDSASQMNSVADLWRAAATAELSGAADPQQRKTPPAGSLVTASGALQRSRSIVTGTKAMQSSRQSRVGEALGSTESAEHIQIPASSDSSPLELIDPEDRITIEISCILIRRDGQAQYDACLRRELAELPRFPRPSFAYLDASVEETIETACLLQRSDGPAAYNSCLWKQAAAAGEENLSMFHKGYRRAPQ